MITNFVEYVRALYLGFVGGIDGAFGLSPAYAFAGAEGRNYSLGGLEVLNSDTCFMGHDKKGGKGTHHLHHHRHTVEVHCGNGANCTADFSLKRKDETARAFLKRSFPSISENEITKALKKYGQLRGQD